MKSIRLFCKIALVSACLLYAGQVFAQSACPITGANQGSIASATSTSNVDVAQLVKEVEIAELQLRLAQIKTEMAGLKYEQARLAQLCKQQPCDPACDAPCDIVKGPKGDKNAQCDKACDKGKPTPPPAPSSK